MNFVSCFSGIEAASVAWAPLGWECIAVAEIEPFPSAVLAHHYPKVPNLGDVLANDFLDRMETAKPDVLVGGPPCQDFSVAGFRAGLDGHRGNLTLRWVQIIHASHARFAVTENVPGWLSVNKGHAFGAFIAALVGHDTDLVPPQKCGGKWTNAGMVDGPNGRACWRILDAQFFNLAQRRARVFVVFCPANGADPAEVLLEPQSMRGDHPPRGKAGESPAGTLASRASAGGGLGTDFDLSGGLIAYSIQERIAANRASNQNGSGVQSNIAYTLEAIGTAQAVAGTLGARTGFSVGAQDASCGHMIAMALNAHPNRLDGESETFVTHSLRADGFDASEDGTGRGTPLVPVAFQSKASHHQSMNPGPISPALEVGKAGGVSTMGRTGVRRLTPRECARLQGFPDDYLDIAYRGKPAADGPKYKALGNSMAVPVMRWIGEKIQKSEGVE